MVLISLDERMNRVKAQVILIEEGHETDEFWEAIGGKGEINQVSGYEESAISSDK